MPAHALGPPVGVSNHNSTDCYVISLFQALACVNLFELRHFVDSSDTEGSDSDGAPSGLDISTYREPVKAIVEFLGKLREGAHRLNRGKTHDKGGRSFRVRAIEIPPDLPR